MPYFNNKKDINLLLIHIPKTGGSSLEIYFSIKYKILLNHESLRSETILECFNNRSLQHFTFQDIINYNNSFYNIDFNDLKILTIVRNPYDRVVSDLFWNKLITINSTKEEIYDELLNSYFNKYKENKDIYDNHVTPQYLYLLDNNNELLKDIIILKTENLNNQMIDLGYKDFNFHSLNSRVDKRDIRKFLNNMSIQLINNFYAKDFEIFGYDKIKINKDEYKEELLKFKRDNYNKINV